MGGGGIGISRGLFINIKYGYSEVSYRFEMNFLFIKKNIISGNCPESI